MAAAHHPSPADRPGYRTHAAGPESRAIVFQLGSWPDECVAAAHRTRRRHPRARRSRRRARTSWRATRPMPQPPRGSSASGIGPTWIAARCVCRRETPGTGSRPISARIARLVLWAARLQCASPSARSLTRGAASGACVLAQIIRGIRGGLAARGWERLPAYGAGRLGWIEAQLGLCRWKGLTAKRKLIHAMLETQKLHRRAQVAPRSTRLRQELFAHLAWQMCGRSPPQQRRDTHAVTGQYRPLELFEVSHEPR